MRAVDENFSLHILAGTRIDRDVLIATPELISNFARAINNPSSCFTHDSTMSIAPPMFGAIPATRIVRRIILKKTLPAEIILGGQKIQFHSPILPGEVLVSDAWAKNVVDNSERTLVDVKIVTKSQSGNTRLIQVLTIYVKAPRHRVRHNHLTRLSEEPRCEVSTQISREHALRYAKASFTRGIALHEDHDHARSLGYRTFILPGQCTMALVTRTITDNILDGNSTAIKTFEARYSHVVYPSEVLRTRIWDDRRLPGHYKFVTVKDDETISMMGEIAHGLSYFSQRSAAVEYAIAPSHPAGHLTSRTKLRRHGAIK